MKRLITIALTLLSALSLQAQPLWMRYCSIAPDGQNIAFSYKGNIYIVNSQGGQARQLTTAPGYEYAPIWSHDGRTIAYAADVHGNFDVFTIDANGGAPCRITTHSTSETPLAFSPDNRHIYYTGTIQDPASSAQFSAAWITELYRVPVQGGRPEQVAANPICNISFAPDGQSFVYYNRAGNENIWRKHHTSSVARDLFLYDIKARTHKLLTANHKGEDRDPNFVGPNKIVFLSERNGGSFNVYEADINNMDNPRALTSFKQHPVRFLTAAQNGTLCFGHMGEIYTMQPGAQPKKLKVEIINDQPAEQLERIRPQGSYDYTMTPDGKQIAIIARGEVFATTDEFATTKQISNTPEAERGVTIAPDGKTLAYASERTGTWNIYTAKMARKQDINFANATLIDEQPLFSDNKVERFSPSFSPDGKELAYIENRNILKVINLDTKKVRQITDGKQHYDTDDYGFSFKWSPDGKWFAITLISNRRQPYSDIAIVSSSGDMKVHNITQSGYIDEAPRWVMNGNAIIYTSNRLGMRSHASWGSQDDVFIAFMNREAQYKFNLSEEEFKVLTEEEKQNSKKDDKKDDKSTDKKDDKKKDEVKDIVVELDGLDERIQRLTPMSSRLSGAIVTHDGEKLFFLSAFEKGYDLWETKIRERSTKLLKKIGGSSASLQLDKKGDNLYIFAGSSIKRMPVKGGDLKNITIEPQMTLNRTKEREYMFNRVFNQHEKRFYKADYHGVDLRQLQKDYRPFLAHINNNYDFAEMLSEILGELNVSHTGASYGHRGVNPDVTSNLGALFSWKHTGNGLKIDEVLAGGPLDKTGKCQAGDIIEKIDGVEIKAGDDFFPLLNNKSGKKVLVQLQRPSSGERFDVVVKPVGNAAINELMYQRWIKRNAEQVDKLSNGRLGYVHIRSMADASYRNVYADILGKYNLREGIVIDTRFNGGGRLHEDIEVLFSGEKYLEQVIRGRVSCEMPSRRYNKPSIMLIGEANYSNAHGTPWVYRHKKMGKLVGMPVPGTMTSVNWETLQDESMYFGIPIIGYRTQDGQYLENSQIEPDILVRNTPEKLEQGIDEQLEAAVKELLKELQTRQSW